MYPIFRPAIPLAALPTKTRLIPGNALTKRDSFFTFHGHESRGTSNACPWRLLFAMKPCRIQTVFQQELVFY